MNLALDRIPLIWPNRHRSISILNLVMFLKREQTSQHGPGFVLCFTPPIRRAVAADIKETKTEKQISPSAKGAMASNLILKW